MTIVDLELTANDRVDNVCALKEILGLHRLLNKAVLSLEDVFGLVGAPTVQQVAHSEGAAEESSHAPFPIYKLLDDTQACSLYVLEGYICGLNQILDGVEFTAHVGEFLVRCQVAEQSSHYFIYLFFVFF